MRGEIEWKRAISLLAEEIHKDRLVIFVGAGCSIAAHLPSWYELLKQLVNSFEIKTNLIDPFRIAGRLDREIGKAKVREAIANILHNKSSKPTDLHKSLASLPVNLFITTNYDHLLENTFRHTGIEPLVLIDDKNIPFIDPTRKTIIKLHGDIDNPSSIIISPSDYRSYKIDHPGFIEWLSAIGMQNTILFIGSSFDDPRLLEMDDHLLNIFGTFRRSPTIILKEPTDHSQKSKKELEATKADFNDRRNELLERGFNVVVVDSYKKIPSFINDLHAKFKESNKLEHISIDKNAAVLSLQADLYDSLRHEFYQFIDEDTKSLIKKINNSGIIPSFSKRLEDIKSLENRLTNPPYDLNNETIEEGYVTLTEAYSSSGRDDDLKQARIYFNQANEIVNHIQNKNSYTNRLLLLKARLLLLENRPSDAKLILEDLDTSKSKILKFAIFLEENKPNEIVSFYKSQKNPDMNWLPFYISALIDIGEISEAEDIFKKTIKDLNVKEHRALIEKLHFHIANAFLDKAFKLEGSPKKILHLLASPLSQDAKISCSKAIYYSEMLFHYIDLSDYNESIIASMTKVITMKAAFIARKIDKADEIAKALLSYRPTIREVAEHVCFRQDSAVFNPSDFQKLANNLVADHPNSFWSWRIITLIRGFHFKEKDLSWEALYIASDLAFAHSEKQEISCMAVDLGHLFGKEEQSESFYKQLLDDDDPVRKFLSAKLLFWQNSREDSENILKDLLLDSTPPEIAWEVRYILAFIAKNKNELDNAKLLLEKSVEIMPNELNIKALISVCASQQDFGRIISAVEKLETISSEDQETTYAKAQAAFNLGMFDLAESSWRKLDFRKSAIYAFGLARTMIATGKEEQALEILNPFISNDEDLDIDCLWQAVNILTTKEKYNNAFSILDKYWEAIQDHPQLLSIHTQLAYRSGNESKANDSIQRLILLNKNGKIPEGLFGEISLDEMKAYIDNTRLKQKEANRNYSMGRFPRLLFAQLNNIPFYLDWRIRTQRRVLTKIDWDSIDYITYCTNSLRVEKEKNKRVLKRIYSPIDANEIVIDISSLLTLHQLNLLSKLEKRFAAIYYPITIEWIFKEEQTKFGHHQKSKEIVYRKIDQLLKTNKLRQIESTEENLEYNFTNLSLLLSKTEKVPFIAAYEPPEEFSSFPDVQIIRMQDLLRYLYTLGKLREDQLRENLSMLNSAHYSNQEDSDNILRNACKIVLSPESIEFLVDRTLFDVIVKMGIQPVVETRVGQYFHNLAMQLDYLAEVGSWQKELTSFLKVSNIFQAFSSPPIEDDSGLYLRCCEATIKYAAENNLNLLTDDRMMQMISDNEWINRQFGTDALLTDLYQNNIITIDQYSRSFVQMCRWRYKFLVPDIDIMLYLAKQYTKSPLGPELELIIDYLMQCMEDPGLFLGEEKTDPPFPIGIKYHLLLIDLWIEFLCKIWIDDNFSIDNKEIITRKIFGFAFPPFPKAVREDIRKRFYSLEDKKALSGIINFAINTKKPEQLHELLNSAFTYYGYRNDNKVNFIENYLHEYLELLLSKSFQDKLSEDTKKEIYERQTNINSLIESLKISTIVKAFTVFYGKNEPVSDSKLEKFLLESEIDIDNPYENLVNDEYELISPVPTTTEKENIQFTVQTPFITLRPVAKEESYIGVPHELIKAISSDIRSKTLHILISEDRVTSATKEKIKNNAKNIVSSIATISSEASEKASKLVLKDFKYSRSLFSEAINTNIDRQDWLDESLDSIFFPNLESVLCDAPEIIHHSNPSRYLSKNAGSLLSDNIALENQPLSSISHAIDIYQKSLGFIPFSPPYDAWNVVSKFLRLGSPNGPSVHDVMPTVQRLLEIADDPLSYLIAWEMYLGASSLAKGREKAAFKNIKFQKSLTSLFFFLINSGFRSENELENAKREFMSQSWLIRKRFAQHYLRYIDLEASKWSDDQKVLCSWWMAKMTADALIKSMGIRSDREKAKLLEVEVNRWYFEKTGYFRIRHIFNIPPQPQSLNRFCTFHSNNQLAMAAMAYIMPKDESGLNGSGFSGMIVTNEIRTEILKLIAPAPDVGLGQLPLTNKDFTSILWHTPLSLSVPSFLRKYYGNRLEFIGKKELQNIIFIESVTSSDFFESFLNEYPFLDENGNPLLAALFMDALYTYLATSGSLPDNALVFREQPTILAHLFNKDTELGSVCTISILRIVKLLLQWTSIEWARAFENQILSVEDRLFANYANPIVEGVIFAILVGANYEIFQRLTNASQDSKEIQSSLWDIKKVLENIKIQSNIPFEYRENLRKVLHDLQVIPEPA